MRAAVIGPICKDNIIIRGHSYFQPGGVTYYTGNALAHLGVEVTVFCSLDIEDKHLLSAFHPQVRTIPISKPGTITFVNEYPGDDPDIRIQRARIFPNEITYQELSDCFADMEAEKFDFIILGPLYHDNLSASTVMSLAEIGPKIVLASQGLVRYLNDDRIVLRHPENVLRLLRNIDLLFVNEIEAKFITGADSEEKAIEILRRKGTTDVIITLGKRGSIISVGDEVIRIPSYPPERLIDPTGAGDSYLAGFIRGMELFGDLRKAGRFAAMTATLTIEHRGPFNRTVTDVKRRLAYYNTF